jgi:predicted transglutaminase-like cysteine proteinase
MKPIVEMGKKAYDVKGRDNSIQEVLVDIAIINYLPRKPRLKYGLRMLSAVAALLMLPACAAPAPLDKFNSGVNGQIQYAADAGADHWQTPEETARRGAGDCEDYAILKMARLPAGYAGNLVLVTELTTQKAHMILRARNLKTGEVVYLDNLRPPVPEEKFGFYYDLIKVMPAGAATRYEMVHGRAAE